MIIGSRSQGIDTKDNPDVDGNPVVESKDPNVLSLITPIDLCVTLMFIPPNIKGQKEVKAQRPQLFH